MACKTSCLRNAEEEDEGEQQNPEGLLIVVTEVRGEEAELKPAPGCRGCAPFKGPNATPVEGGDALGVLEAVNEGEGRK